MDRPRPIRSVRQRLAAPLVRYLDARFDAIEARVDSITLSSPRFDPLGTVDVSDHNAGASPPVFDHVVSQAASAQQFADPNFARLRREVFPGSIQLPTGNTPVTAPHRKVWEFVYVLRAAEQHEVLRSGRSALGFGVGTEPVPAALAKRGLTVLATDQQGTTGAGDWMTTGQHMSDLSALSKPEIVPDDVLHQLVRARYVDMTSLPDDLGTFDLVWSCCALEHLGSPGAGVDFVLDTLPLLRPGGVSVHTTELELTRRTDTADYDNLVVYRTEDLDDLVREIRGRGYEIETNWYVALETPNDRYISMPPHDEPHLKLALGDSVFTSVGLLIRRPPEPVSGEAGETR